MFNISVTDDLVSLDQSIYDQFIKLHSQLFGEKYTSEMEVALKEKKSAALITALDRNDLIGFKLGYELKPGTFYSWMGGVWEQHRGKGVATALMKVQHEWCTNHSYKKIRTKTKNKWRAMLILNIKNGFDVVGTYTDSLGEPKIILEKRLP
jgi:predicted GNAT superfamily acetyltransferase